MENALQVETFLRSASGPSLKKLQRSERQFQDIPWGLRAWRWIQQVPTQGGFLSSLGELSKKLLWEVIYSYVHEHISWAVTVD